MAKGDIWTQIFANRSGGQSESRQPSAGVEEQWTSFGMYALEGSAPDQTPAVIIYMKDGTNNDVQLENGNSGTFARAWGKQHLIATNTNYMRIDNSASTGDMHISGIQVG